MKLIKTIFAMLLVLLVFLVTAWAVNKYHQPGQLSVIEAQDMDMSTMRPPTGAAPVALAAARQGSLADTVTYTGTVQPYNEENITPRITGQVIALPVYPGDSVQKGELIAQLDTSGVAPQAAQAADQARAARIGEQLSTQVQVQSKKAAQLQAQAQMAAAQQDIPNAEAQVQAAEDAEKNAEAGVQSAQANATYWKSEISREKQLAVAGAVSQQAYQNELAKAQSADAAVTQAQAGVHQSQAMVSAAQAKVQQAHQQVLVAAAAERVAQEEVAAAQGTAAEDAANAQAAQAGAQAAQINQGYARIVSPANGVVTARPVAPGTLVQPGTTLLTLDEINRVRVQANVAIEDIGAIHVGSPVSIKIQGAGTQRIHAHVSSVFPAASASTRTAVVEAIVPNPGHRLLPGAFVTMQITKDTLSNTLLVPTSALVYQSGQAYLWTVNGSAAAPVRYLAHCGLIYSAQFAKAHNYICPMDHLPLTRMASSAKNTGGELTVHEAAVQSGASNGESTQIAAGPLTAGEQVVTHGQAGLSDGTRVIATGWGPNGPAALPTAATANAGQTLYRCVKCGLTFSAAQAKKDHYIDPMDGGQLVPVKPQAAKSMAQMGM